MPCSLWCFPSFIVATLLNRIANPRSAVRQKAVSGACYHNKNIKHFRQAENRNPNITKRTGKNPSFEKAYIARNLLEFDLSASLFELSLDFLSFSLRSAFLDSLRSSFNELLSFLKTKTANVLNCLDNSHLSITE